MILSKAVTKRARARLTSQGQITIPKLVRDVMSLVPGDEIEFQIGSSVVVRRHRRPEILSFAGIAREAAARLPTTAAGIDDLIAETRRARSHDRPRGGGR